MDTFFFYVRCTSIAPRGQDQSHVLGGHPLFCFPKQAGGVPAFLGQCASRYGAFARAVTVERSSPIIRDQLLPC